jgi:hypothetical protein
MVKELFQLLIDCIKSPKKYIYDVIENNRTRHQLLLLILIGIISAFNNGLFVYFKTDKSFIAYFLQSVLLGGIFGWVGLYFLSYVVSVVGLLFKSNTHGDKILNVFAYSYVPILIVFVIVLLEFILISFFGLTFEIAILIRIFGICNIIIMIYCFVVLTIGVSKVQGLPIFKGFLTLFIPMFVLINVVFLTMLILK